MIGAVVVLIGFLWAVPSWAVCSAPSVDPDGKTFRTVGALTTAEINLCVTASASGDRIKLINGTASVSVTLPSSKDLDIQGTTVITCTGGTWTNDPLSCSMTATGTTLTCSLCFRLNLQAIHRISGINFTGITDQTGFEWDGVDTPGKYFRIHGNRMAASSWARINVSGDQNNTGRHMTGIFDHNFIQNISLTNYGAMYQWDESCTLCQDQVWAQTPPFGGAANMVFIESNHFNGTGNCTNFTDGNQGARTVFRGNRGTGVCTAFIEGHGMQGDNRGPQLIESYLNTLSFLPSFNVTGLTWMRGGSGRAFLNTATVAVGAGELTNDRSELDDAIPVVGHCNGSAPSGVDQNTSGQSGWRCRDQIGVGQDATLWSHSASGPPFGAYNQVAWPVYYWENRDTGGITLADPSTQGNNDIHIVANRDFYDHSTATGSPQTVGVRSGPIASRPANCTAGVGYWATDEGEWNSAHAGADGRLYRCTGNAWELYYTPLTFPHPLIVGAAPDTLPPAAPTNLRFSALQGPHD